MVVEDYFGQRGAIKCAGDDLDTNSIMAPHQFPFITGQGAGFEQDFIWNSNFSDVVEQGSDFQNVDLCRFK